MSMRQAAPPVQQASTLEELVKEINQGILTCLFHGFQYRLDRGECLTFPGLPLQSCPVQIDGNKVFVQLGG